MAFSPQNLAVQHILCFENEQASLACDNLLHRGGNTMRAESSSWSDSRSPQLLAYVYVYCAPECSVRSQH